jgi:hypothetical protein
VKTTILEHNGGSWLRQLVINGHYLNQTSVTLHFTIAGIQHTTYRSGTQFADLNLRPVV